MSNNSKRAGEIAGRMLRERADQNAKSLLPSLIEARQLGNLTNEDMASHLTRQNIPTARGHQVWNVRQVQELVARLKRLALFP